MSHQRTIAAIGAAVQDVFLHNSDAFAPVCHKPHECFMHLQLGAKLDMNAITFSTGGGAANAAVTFARQGHRAVFIGVVGRDPAAQAIRQVLVEEGVDITRMQESRTYNTGYSVLLLAPNGERTILTYRGASMHYSPQQFQLDGLHPDWLYVSSLAGNMPVLRHIFAWAYAHGVQVCFNPGKGELAQPYSLRKLLKNTAVLLVNKEEAQQIVPGATAEELVRQLLAYVPVAIVSDGSNGVVASDSTTIVTAGTYEDVPLVDRTGAGDAFGSGFLSAWARGEGLAQAVTYASANATAVVGKIGAKTGILYHNAHVHTMPLVQTSLV